MDIQVKANPEERSFKMDIRSSEFDSHIRLMVKADDIARQCLIGCQYLNCTRIAMDPKEEDLFYLQYLCMQYDDKPWENNKPYMPADVAAKYGIDSFIKNAMMGAYAKDGILHIVVDLPHNTSLAHVKKMLKRYSGSITRSEFKKRVMLYTKVMSCIDSFFVNIQLQSQYHD